MNRRRKEAKYTKNIPLKISKLVNRGKNLSLFGAGSLLLR